MTRPSRLALVAAGALFLAFFANVSLGALGQKPPLGDVQEMLMLFAASILFAAAVLVFEADGPANSNNTAEES